MDGAIAAWPNPKSNKPFGQMLTAIGDAFQIPLDVPFRKLEPIQQRLSEIDDAEAAAILHRGADKARDIAAPVMERARRAIGLLL